MRKVCRTFCIFWYYFDILLHFTNRIFCIVSKNTNILQFQNSFYNSQIFYKKIFLCSIRVFVFHDTLIEVVVEFPNFSWQAVQDALHFQSGSRAEDPDCTKNY